MISRQVHFATVRAKVPGSPSALRGVALATLALTVLAGCSSTTTTAKDTTPGVSAAAEGSDGSAAGSGADGSGADGSGADGSGADGSGAVLLDDAGQPIGETTTTSAEVEIVSTVPPGPTTTIPNGGGAKLSFADGTPVSDKVSETADLVYQAAIRRDYARLAIIIGDRRFRWGFIGQRGPAATWQKDFMEGKSDEVKRIVALLETTPAKDGQGRTVWPAIAVKPPEEWTADDDALAAALGFQPEDIAQTKLKGQYRDIRLTIEPDGIWSGFYVGE